MLKILVIGNGFDKAHGLETGYSDFLNWLQDFRMVHHEQQRVYGGVISSSSDAREKYHILKNENWSEFREVVNVLDNFWFSHFIKVQNTLGDKWLDFEREIERVTKRIYDSLMSNKSSIQSLLREESYRTYSNVPHNFVNNQECFEWLSKQLREITRVFEIYLCKFVNDKLDKSSRIKLFTEIKPNKVISFNYTSTYRDVYNFGIATNYIHGKATMNGSVSECSLVLGYDDHYINSANTVMELIPFEKYYQRIIYRNSNEYFDWVNSLGKDGKPEPKTVYFFGHSLSPADGDIIKLLIESENTKTVIFYRESHDDERANMIKNLAMILTPNGLIKRTGGKSPTIEFRPI